ncbi:hypothetical protein [Fibrobacter sp. UWH4]|uniref:phage neck terminator protein n=1 Tax=Fibrobacter sp. UWH4 TaxID=1896210 RepID=UPI00091A0A8C|nr:hypothetical protein [Fibrobacter sp. UWH4]SHL04930.1 hypothetical protein SAMN05720762_10459 [Fibrobacter sp. UWH4]
MSSIVEDIKGAICHYFNEHQLMDCPFVKAPSNIPAPVGKYIAVRVEQVEQHGSEMQPPPGDNARFAFEQVATVAFIEVEGDGETLRMVRNLVQRKDFRDSAVAEGGFAVWDFTSILPIDTFDGEFVVRQWRFTMRVNFADEILQDVPRIESVEPLTLTGE